MRWKPSSPASRTHPMAGYRCAVRCGCAHCTSDSGGMQDEELDTIAGYIMQCLGSTARVGDVLATLDGTIRVENMARGRIIQVAMKGSGQNGVKIYAKLSAVA